MDMPFAGDLTCSNGVCDFDHCTKDANCSGGTVCFNGDCVTVPDCSEIASCAVVPGSTVTQEDDTVQMSGTAYFTSGALAPGVTFTWAAVDADSCTGVGGDNCAAVSATGLVTGGAGTGDATVTATVSGCAVTCYAMVSNYGAVAGGATRVVVINELKGTPVEGADVMIGDQSGVTLANGVVEVNGAPNPADITVSHKQYNYVTVLGVTSNNVIVHLGEITHVDFSGGSPVEMAGGVKGKFDFSRITCEPGNSCDVHFGLGGLSIPGNLVNLNFDMLIGGSIMTHLEFMGEGIDAALPSGLVLCLNNVCFKEDYLPLGVPGTRATWGLGGKLNLKDILPVLTDVIGGDDVDFGAILVGLLPMFDQFYTDVVPNVTVPNKPMVVDTEDLNDNGEVDDMVPDYDNPQAFPKQDMTLKVPVDQTMTFTMPNMPVNPAGGFWYDGVLIIAGVIAKDIGLVPLGLSMGLDITEKTDTPDGVIDETVVVHIADVAGRIPEEQVQRVVIELAVDTEGLFGSGKTVLGGRVLFLDAATGFSGNITLPAFLTPPDTVSYNRTNRELTVAGIPGGIAYNQLTLDGELGSTWNVMGVFEDGTYAVPAAPASGDRAQDAKFVSLSLRDNLTLEDLVNFSGDNLGNLVELVDAFTFYEVTTVE